MMTSARATPSPATSGMSRSSASRTRSGILQPLGEQLRRASHRRREPLGVLVLQRHREAAQRAPRGDVAAHRSCADDVHVRRESPAIAFLSRPNAFSRSWSLNTRIRFAAVGDCNRCAIDAGSDGGAASASPSYLTQISRIAYGAG